MSIVWELKRYEKVAEGNKERFVHIECSECDWQLNIPVIFDVFRGYYTYEHDLQAKSIAEKALTHHIKQEHEGLMGKLKEHKVIAYCEKYGVKQLISEALKLKMLFDYSPEEAIDKVIASSSVGGKPKQ